MEECSCSLLWMKMQNKMSKKGIVEEASSLVKTLLLYLLEIEINGQLKLWDTKDF